MKPVCLSLLIIWLAAAELRGAGKASAVTCTFKDRTYSPGASWHPYLEPFGFLFCLRCGCSEEGRVRCSSIRCPPAPCEQPVSEPRQCCPRCSDQPRVPAGLRASAKACRYNGSVHQPGETFTKHNLFPSRNSNQCVLCTCSNGNIFCALKTCPPLTCSSPVPAPETCCLVCKDPASSGSSADDGNQQLNRGVRHSVDQCSAELRKARPEHRATPPHRSLPPRVRAPSPGRALSKLNLRGASETTVKILLQRKQRRACLYNGKTYSHGDTWHPVLGKVLECILCTCTDGVQSCQRITCPREYPCQHPVKSAGKCCKTCPGFRTPDSQAESNHTQCYAGYRNHVLVYKVESPLDVDSPHSVRIVAVERQSTSELEVHVWSTAEGVLHLMEIGDVQRKDVLDHSGNYTLLTTLDEDMWRKFKELGGNLSKAPQTTICQDGIREIMTFLNPRQTEGSCSP